MKVASQHQSCGLAASNSLSLAASYDYGPDASYDCSLAASYDCGLAQQWAGSNEDQIISLMQCRNAYAEAQMVTDKHMRCGEEAEGIDARERAHLVYVVETRAREVNIFICIGSEQPDLPAQSHAHECAQQPERSLGIEAIRVFVTLQCVLFGRSS